MGFTNIPKGFLKGPLEIFVLPMAIDELEFFPRDPEGEIPKDHLRKVPYHLFTTY